MDQITIGFSALDAVELHEYGNPVAPVSGKAPDSQGTGWQCWYPLGDLSSQGTKQIGLVKSTLAEPKIRLVECHPTREEWMYAIYKPVVQVMALTSQRTDGQADIETSKAILLEPGQGFIIKPGVWHAPAFAADLGEALYGFLLTKGDPEIKESGLVPFFGGSLLIIHW